MKIFFYGSHTLYYKSLLPLIIRLAAHPDMTVIVHQTHPNFYIYTPFKYSKNPTKNTCINVHSLRYVSSILEMQSEFESIKSKIFFSFLKSKAKCSDVVIGTVKDLPWLLKMKKKVGYQKILAMPYQHIPFLLSLTGSFKLLKSNKTHEGSLIESNGFFRRHNFKQIFNLPEVEDAMLVGFPHLDRYNGKPHFNNNSCEKKYVLIFHPGGYRGILTNPGDSRQVCYEKQSEFLERICKPIVDVGLIPVIKTHPLFARYHSKEDLDKILSQLIKKKSLYNQVEVIDSSYWPYAFQSKIILTFGSSSIYELYSAGLYNVYICSFFGASRASKFSMFENIIIRSYDEYKKVFSSKTHSENRLLESIQNIYFSLHQKPIVSSLVQEIMYQ